MNFTGINISNANIHRYDSVQTLMHDIILADSTVLSRKRETDTFVHIRSAAKWRSRGNTPIQIWMIMSPKESIINSELDAENEQFVNYIQCALDNPHENLDLPVAYAVGEARDDETGITACLVFQRPDWTTLDTLIGDNIKVTSGKTVPRDKYTLLAARVALLHDIASGMAQMHYGHTDHAYILGSMCPKSILVVRNPNLGHSSSSLNLPVAKIGRLDMAMRVNIRGDKTSNALFSRATATHSGMTLQINHVYPKEKFNFIPDQFMDPSKRKKERDRARSNFHTTFPWSSKDDIYAFGAIVKALCLDPLTTDLALEMQVGKTTNDMINMAIVFLTDLVTACTDDNNDIRYTADRLLPIIGKIFRIFVPPHTYEMSHGSITNDNKALAPADVRHQKYEKWERETGGNAQPQDYSWENINHSHDPDLDNVVDDNDDDNDDNNEYRSRLNRRRTRSPSQTSTTSQRRSVSRSGSGHGSRSSPIILSPDYYHPSQSPRLAKPSTLF